MKGIIVLGGNYNINSTKYYLKYLTEADFIVCADSGAHFLRDTGFVPHLLIGDFDSILEEDYKYFKSKGVEIREFPVQKDYTDGELAIDAAILANCNEIIIIGGTGGRLDHFFANVFMLKKLIDINISGKIIDENNEIILINNKIIIFKENEEDIISLIPISDIVEGVTTNGLFYELKDKILKFGSSLGISNEFISNRAEISIKNGLLLVIKSKKEIFYASN